MGKNIWKLLTLSLLICFIYVMPVSAAEITTVEDKIDYLVGECEKNAYESE